MELELHVLFRLGPVRTITFKLQRRNARAERGKKYLMEMSMEDETRHSSLARFIMQLPMWRFCHNLRVISAKRLRPWRRRQKRVDVWVMKALAGFVGRPEMAGLIAISYRVIRVLSIFHTPWKYYKSTLFFHPLIIFLIICSRGIYVGQIKGDKLVLKYVF